ncbi:hypothetical protein LSH36_162g02003 [Paralvinella palmiformis]|uniref:Dynein assembly factor 3, axonemal n=1 Tax=Paralvinella palmiformis TaxID=53620 RepID=A0AAD9JTI1_9ANNE|nr:hypothetical protein LSH36_162g02003 [Paralvinella palmiformis]
MDAFGSITWWGFTPAQDLRDDDLTLAASKLRLQMVNEDDELNILMIGAGDCRHILKTLARSYRHRQRKIHFYILENNIELYARHMLLLTLALEPKIRMGLQEKTELFLELYGNSLVRQQSNAYVEKMSNMFIKMVTDFDYLDKKLPILDLSLLKFKERDFLEAIFKFWRNPDRSLFDIEKAWDLRLRKHLGVRYDAIPGVFDWDYSMKLCHKGASIINYHQYKQWRHKGIAFEIREGSYDIPNKTLASGMVFKLEGECIARRGYWGDILVSPYISFGIECEEKEFFKTANNIHVKTAQDVSEYNILSYFHELTHRSKYVPPEVKNTSKPKEAELTEITEEEEEEVVTTDPEKVDANEVDDDYDDNDDTTEINPLDLEYEPVELDYVKVHFLPLNSAETLNKKSRYQKLFDCVYLSNSMVHVLNETLTETFSDVATVILETSKFLLELSDAQHKQYLDKIVSIAKSVGCKETDTPEVGNSYAEFIFQRTTHSQ